MLIFNLYYMFKVPEKYRLTVGMMATSSKDGNNGIFRVPIDGLEATVIASDGEGWEHVSVSFFNRIPTWDEMCRIKDIFWGEDECVVQYHPPKKDYVNNCKNCLHLWRPTGGGFKRPPKVMVGI